MNKDWLVTDPSCNQMCRQLSDTIFEFKEDRIINPETKEIEVYESIIDLHDYSIDEIMENLTPYGYKKTGDLIHDGLGNELPNSIIAECIFEQET